MSTFVHLHVHSYFSLCRGVNAPEEICAAAARFGLPYLALTDTNGVYGLIRFLQAAKDHGLVPLVGAEVSTANERAVLLCKSQRGYRNLSHILTERHLKPDFSLVEAILQRPEDLVVLSDCPSVLDRLARHLSCQDLYAELRISAPRRALLEFARSRGLQPVATAGSYFLTPADYILHRLLRAIATNSTLERVPGSELAPPTALFHSPQAMAQAFSSVPEALANTVRIAEKCVFEFGFGGFVFVPVTGPDGQSAFDYLRHLCYEGARWRYGEITEPVRQRLEYELEIIREKGFAPYFLVVHEIVKQAPRTCGRGSAAASLVSYCLGITHVDPVRYDLFFERFLNRGRKDPPDIDVDFPWDERDQVLEWTFARFGRESTAMISNHVTFKARAAVREIAKVYGLPEQEIGRVSKRIPGYWDAESVSALVASHPAFRDLDLPPPWPEILRLADRIHDFPRHLSVHPGGVVIVPGKVEDYVPVEMAAKGVRIIQWEKDQAEDAGLVKIDLLGNRSLAVIRDALRAIEEHHGIRIDYAQWNPLEDRATQELIARGDTMGVFYVESPAMRLLQRKTGTGDFEHLVIHSSIIRPAANTYIREYVRRLRGGSYEPIHPLLEQIMRDTYGIMVYQEDVSRVAMELAGFDAAEADELRKVLSKKHRQKQLQDYREKFYHGALERGVPKDTIDKIWDMILSFSGYSFCKPHSASYALVSYKSAYLRAHFPAEFMAAVISNQGGYYSTFAYISEAKRMGLRILPPDINESDIPYTGSNDWIRVGLMQVKQMRQESLEAIVEERRRNGPYLSLRDFLRRVKLDASEVRQLIKAGAFDSVEPSLTRPQMMWLASFYARPKARVTAYPDLFDLPTEDALPPALPEYDERTRLRLELEALGLLISKHPLELYRDRLQALRVIPAKDLPRYPGKRVQVAGWLITEKLAKTKEEELMEFVSFEDTTALYDATFFPEAYNRFCYMLSYTRPYLLTGIVEEDFGAFTLTVEKVQFL
ncbi:MAG: DNA polymerase III subunit alpha [candidate division KSB1 bacterium]|nr:DNA polymerase III subunit alpha [candidate division KSB1 bacterium]